MKAYSLAASGSSPGALPSDAASPTAVVPASRGTVASAASDPSDASSDGAVAPSAATSLAASPGTPVVASADVASEADVVLPSPAIAPFSSGFAVAPQAIDASAKTMAVAIVVTFHEVSFTTACRLAMGVYPATTPDAVIGFAFGTTPAPVTMTGSRFDDVGAGMKGQYHLFADTSGDETLAPQSSDAGRRLSRSGTNPKRSSASTAYPDSTTRHAAPPRH